MEKAAGSGEVFRLNPDEFEAYKDAQVFATTKVVHHSPFNADRNGPYPKGRTLGMTMAEAVRLPCVFGRPGLSVEVRLNA